MVQILHSTNRVSSKSMESCPCACAFERHISHNYPLRYIAGLLYFVNVSLELSIIISCTHNHGRRTGLYSVLALACTYLVACLGEALVLAQSYLANSLQKKIKCSVML